MTCQMTASVVIGKNLSVDIIGHDRAELGLPMVEMFGDIDRMQHLTIDQARQIANGLMAAADVAEGKRDILHNGGQG